MNDNNRLSVINLAAADETPAFPKTKIEKQRKIVAFGASNMFPQEIIDISTKSPVNSSIIKNTVTYILAGGVDNNPDEVSGYASRPNKQMTWNTLIERLAIDYELFGGFYFQVIKNKDNSTVSIFHQDFSEVRIGEISDTGEILSFKIAADWKKTTGKAKPKDIEVWRGLENAEPGVAYLYYYYNYQPGLKFYCVPDYYSAIEYVRADGSLGQFYNNTIDNGFVPSAVFTFASNPDEKIKQNFENDVKRTFCGSRGAGGIICVWGESTTNKSVIDAFDASNNADIYNNIEGIIFQKIISGHRLTSPTLAGVSGSGNLSGNAAEIIDAYILYNYTVINKKRQTILDALNIFTSINKTAALKIKDTEAIKRLRETETPKEETKLAKSKPAKKQTFKEKIINLWK